MFEEILWLVVMMATVALATPVVVLGTIFFYGGIALVAEKAIGRLFPASAPACDADPLCHPAFRWGQDGHGWINGVCVNSKTIAGA